VLFNSHSKECTRTSPLPPILGVLNQSPQNWGLGADRDFQNRKSPKELPNKSSSQPRHSGCQWRIQEKNTFGHLSAIARTRAGMNSALLAAKSTRSGLPDPGLCVQSEPLDGANDHRRSSQFLTDFARRAPNSFRRGECDRRSCSNCAFIFWCQVDDS
jgi:hypothetical protein